MTHHLAQINIAKPRYGQRDPRFAGFMNALEAVNAFAEMSPGFVWRLKDDTGAGATDMDPFSDGTLINMSVWESVEALQHFVYKTGHASFVRRKKEWFPKMDTPHIALWWIKAGEIPTIGDGLSRLKVLEAHGSTAEAFTFSQQFDPVD